jgi:phosphoribosylpyrophosphate synthetase
LLDDTWTTGGHLQSASAALKAAGAHRVTGLVVARWLDPEFAETKAFINALTTGFEPLLCPFTGGYC